MKRLPFYALIVMLTASCCGCRVSNRSQKELVTSNQWVLDKAGSEKEQYTLAFDAMKGQISGRGTCNSFFGTYKFDGRNGIKLDPAGMTRMFCNDEGVENEYINTLSAADEFGFEGKNLVLLKEGKVIARFLLE